MVTVTLRNSYHNTSVGRDGVTRDQQARARRQVARVRQTLCGAEGCTCGVVRD